MYHRIRSCQRTALGRRVGPPENAICLLEYWITWKRYQTGLRNEKLYWYNGGGNRTNALAVQSSESGEEFVVVRQVVQDGALRMAEFIRRNLVNQPFEVRVDAESFSKYSVVKGCLVNR